MLEQQHLVLVLRLWQRTYGCCEKFYRYSDCTIPDFGYRCSNVPKRDVFVPMEDWLRSSKIARGASVELTGSSQVGRSPRLARWWLPVAMAFLCLGASACDDVTPVPTSKSTPPSTRAAMPSRTQAIRDCPRTMPVRAPQAIRSMPGWNRAYGNSALWVGGLGVDGVLGASTVGPDEYNVKLPWWRLKRGILHIAGSRLGDEGVTIGSHVPEGYGLSGFQSTAVRFPSEGCYRVTGTIGVEPLTFVTYVVMDK